MKYTFLLFTILLGVSFKESQLKYSRVKIAFDEKEMTVRQYFTSKNLNYSDFQIFIRAFKKEEVLEVWVKDTHHTSYALLHTYDFCTTSGTLGPKRREGDLQIPEGVYHINHFNPQSNFYLSLGLNYPNASDKILSDKKHPGGSIYIHGSCVTIGCIPITDDKIKELYILAVEARDNGQEKIPVHIFPTRLTEQGFLMLKNSSSTVENYRLWESLKNVYLDFEETKKLKPVKVNGEGMYQF